MNNYNIYLNTEEEKYAFLSLAKASGAKITGVSGCGAGYYIQLSATPEQAFTINNAIRESVSA